MIRNGKTEKQKAINEWLRNHKPGEGWRPVSGYMLSKRQPVVLLHNPDDPYPYSLQYAGSGHYFTDIEEVRAYALTRHWDTALLLGPLKV